MTDLPILFSAPMVRALLDGRKTQTRRIIKDAPTAPGWTLYSAEGKHTWLGPNGYPSMPCTVRFAKGDRLWVRETFSFDHSWTGTKPSEVIPAAPVHYWADGNPIEGDWTKPKPGIHMPQWVSRLTLTVTDVRVQRLQEITPADAIAEGIWAPANSMTIDCETRDPRDDFQALWNSINGAGSWGANPWIVALTFTVERRNIDAARAA